MRAAFYSATRRTCLLTLLVTLVVLAAPLLGHAGAGSVVEESELQANAVRADPTPVIFSHDGDFDDMAALAYLARLHKAHRIDLRLVAVTYAGAALPGRGIRHTRCLLERFGLTDIPVVDSPASGANAFPDLLRFTF